MDFLSILSNFTPTEREATLDRMNKIIMQRVAVKLSSALPPEELDTLIGEFGKNPEYDLEKHPKGDIIKTYIVRETERFLADFIKAQNE